MKSGHEWLFFLLCTARTITFNFDVKKGNEEDGKTMNDINLNYCIKGRAI